MAVVADVAEIVLLLALIPGRFAGLARGRAGSRGYGNRAHNRALNAEFEHSVVVVVVMPGVRDARGHQYESRRCSDSRSNQTHVSSPLFS
jgi:hypothetical protein